MTRIGRPLAASIAIHVGGLMLIAVLAARLTPPALPIATPSKVVEVVFEAPKPAAPTPVLVPPPPPPEPSAAEIAPPPPEPPPALAPPPVPALPHPPAPKPPPKPVVHKPTPKPPSPEPMRMPEPMRAPEPPRPVQLPPQTAAMPVPMPHPSPTPAPAAPTISAGYRGALSGWLENHKHYPESARARGEEGRVVLRFRVDRYGRLLDYAVVGSSGYPELDAAVDAMMRGATLPPFPADMTANDIQVTVTVRFGLSR